LLSFQGVLFICILFFLTHCKHGRRKGSREAIDFENFNKQKDVFLLSSGKKQISPFLALPRTILEKSPCGPLMEKILPTPMIANCLCIMNHKHVMYQVSV